MTTSHQFITGEHPELRRIAHRHFRRARRAGRIPREKKCEICGAENLRIVAHHPDYARFYDVIFLCEACHMKTHWGTAN